jgi:putative toxin-antitoxin system antitoxin component (TIGR02293 family)
MEMSKERMYYTVGLPRATVDRKISADERLSPGQSERVVGLTQLIGLAHAMVEESGDLKGFDAAVWVSDWLDQPHPALGGAKPGEFMDTAEGCTLVSNLLAQQQSGAYA